MRRHDAAMRPDPASALGRLMDAPMRAGRVVWIGLRPARRAPMLVVETAELVAGLGLAGDRYGRAGGERQVTLAAAEALQALASHLGLLHTPPELVRRNIVTRGINLLALKDRRFRVGQALLQGSGECHPCSRMEEALGTGGYNAMRGLGGITARVLEGGRIALGDAVVRVDDS
jgi:MOSC domain-containing protein YiiM